MRTIIVFLLCLIATIFASSGNGENLITWEEIVQHGAIPPPLSDGGSTSSGGDWVIFGGLNGSFPADYPVNILRKFYIDARTWVSFEGYPNAPEPRVEPMFFPGTDGSVISCGGRGPFRRRMDLTFSDCFQFHEKTGWKLISQPAATQAFANRSTEATGHFNKNCGRAYAFSGTSSTMPSFVNLPGALQTNVITMEDTCHPEGGWSELKPKNNAPVPRGRGHHPIVYSHRNKALYVYGGYTNDPLQNATFSERNYLDDFWSFSVNSRKWKQYVPAAGEPHPGKRDNAKLFIDDRKERVWLYGGANFDGSVYNDLWYFDLKTERWNLVDLTSAGPLPEPRFGQYYFHRETATDIEFYMFGGAIGETNSYLKNDMWLLKIKKAF